MPAESLGDAGGLGKLEAAAAVPLPFPGPLHITGGLRWLELYLTGCSGMTLVPLLLEGFSKNQENHHKPTLTWWSSAIRLRYQFRGPAWWKWVEMSHFQSKLSPPHPLLPRWETGKRLFAKLPWVHQPKPCIKMDFWAVLLGPALSGAQTTDNAFFYFFFF